MQWDLFTKTCSDEERAKAVSVPGPSRESPPIIAKPGPSVKGGSGESLHKEDTESLDIFKSNVKRKTRMECAEQGQLRPISFAYVDPEQASDKNND